ncbi:MAG TPA: glycosyltransferase [Candidatus Acidoferrales bacterium]|nr:glycosyltransferase [Candidatus Acidoferrales bacterium]
MIIPARNEQFSIARAVESVAVQNEVGEIVVVNDQSSDRTGDILAQLAKRIPKLKVLQTVELPDRWVGKNYAVSLGAAVASGDWLLFTDADTYHGTGSVARGLADAVDHEAVLVSYSPEQDLKTFWEKALVPFVYCRLAARFAFARVNDPRQPDAAANGQFILILRDVYERVGGHAAVACQILEDVALARRVKQAGYGIYFTAPMGVVRTRMYRSFTAMWQGWTKNLYPLAGGNLRSVLAELVEALPLPELAALAALLVSYCVGVPAMFLAWLAGAMVGAAVSRAIFYASALYRNLYPISYIQYCYVGSLLYGAALVGSWWKSTYGTVVWKGRTYPSKIR